MNSIKLNAMFGSYVDVKIKLCLLFQIILFLVNHIIICFCKTNSIKGKKWYIILLSCGDVRNKLQLCLSVTETIVNQPDASCTACNWTK
jgi:hypothetical protein